MLKNPQFAICVNPILRSHNFIGTTPSVALLRSLNKCIATFFAPSYRVFLMAKPPANAAVPPRVIQVAAGLIFRGDQLLITQRRQQDHLGGLWEFPGGKRHPGETFAACLARELREELAIEVEVGPLYESIRHDYPEKRVLLKFYLCRWRRHEPQALGCARFAWITRADLAQYPFPAADAQLIERLLREPVQPL